MEQDPPLEIGNDELPTYDDLAIQQGPNSRCASPVDDCYDFCRILTMLSDLEGGRVG